MDLVERPLPIPDVASHDLKDISSPHQSSVDDYFDARSLYWKELYTDEAGVMGEIIKDRLVHVLRLLDMLSLAPATRVLDAGCGTGFLSLALAKRGLQVTALDTSPAMLERVKQNAADHGVGEQISTRHGDITNLDFPSDSLELVTAVGVVSWIEDPAAAVREIARVLKPGGHAIFTTTNKYELPALLDPVRLPPLRPLKLWAKRVLEGIGLRQPSPNIRYRSTTSMGQILTASGMEVLATETVGFGPFTLLTVHVIPDSLGVRIHKLGQRLADGGFPLLRSSGMSRIFLVRKSAAA